MIYGIGKRAAYTRAAAIVIGCILLAGSLVFPVRPRASLPAGTALESALQTAVFRDAAEPRLDEEMPTAEPATLSLDPREQYQAVMDDLLRPRPFTHAIEPGDTVWRLAQRYETDLGTLLDLNPELDPWRLRLGEPVRIIAGFRGIAYEVAPEDSLEAIAVQYDVAAVDIQLINGLSPDGSVQPGQTLLLPGARPRRALLASRGGPDRSEAPDPASTPSRSIATGGWVWPIEGGIHSSEFGGRWGGFHSGMDIAVPTGTEAVAAAAGIVSFAGWDGGYGYCVVIDHGDGVQTKYAHASALLVQEGQQVGQGQPVIRVGSTGNSTGPHLHFEVLVDGVPRNPRHYLP